MKPVAVELAAYQCRSEEAYALCAMTVQAGEPLPSGKRPFRNIGAPDMEADTRGRQFMIWYVMAAILGVLLFHVLDQLKRYSTVNSRHYSIKWRRSVSS